MINRRPPDTNINVNLSLSPEFATLLGEFRKDILAAFKRTETNMVQRIESVRADFAAFMTAFDAYLQTVDQAVEAAKAQAVLDDDAAESAVIDQLAADIAAARAKLPTPPPVEPPVE